MEPDNPRHDSRGSSRALTAFHECVVILCGITVACLVYLLRRLNDYAMKTKRAYYVHYLTNTSSTVVEEPVLLAWAVYTGAGLVLATIAYILVAGVPQAQGSGLPPLIAFLNGVKVKYYASMCVLVAKFFSTVATVSAGLYAGPEGPIIHMGLAVAKQTLRACCRLCALLHKAVPLQWLYDAAHSNDAHVEREIAAIGAGAGLAAAFYAPLTATFFVVEEASSHFSLPLLWHAFSAAMAALFVTHSLNDNNAVNSYITVQEGQGTVCRPHVVEFFAVACIGVIGGAFGAAYNTLVLRFKKARTACARFFAGGSDSSSPYAAPRRMLAELLIVLVVAFLSSTCSLFVADAEAAAGGCIPKTVGGVIYGDLAIGAQASPLVEHRMITLASHELIGGSDLCLTSTVDSVLNPLTSGRRTLCNASCLSAYVNITALDTYSCDVYDVHGAPPTFSPLGTLLLQDSRQTATALLARGIPQSLPPLSLGIAFLLWFVLSALAAGLPLPVGLLVPSIVIGGCIGRLCGVLLFTLVRGLREDREYQENEPWVSGVNIDVSLFALCGAAAFLGGSGRIRLTFTSLCIEMTHQLFLLPYVAVAALIGVAIGNLFTARGLYHELIHDSGLPYVPSFRPAARCVIDAGNGRRLLRARDVMASGPIAINASITKAAARAEALASPEAMRHSGFPVVDEGGRLVGLLLRDELDLAEHGDDALVRDVMDRSPATCHVAWPVERAHSLFAAMGLSHLLVLGEPGSVRAHRGRTTYHGATPPAAPLSHALFVSCVCIWPAG